MNQNTILDQHEVIVNALSVLIRGHLLNAAAQQYNPDTNPDQMDFIIADGKKKAKSLQRLREDFEKISTGIIYDY